MLSMLHRCLCILCLLCIYPISQVLYAQKAFEEDALPFSFEKYQKRMTDKFSRIEMELNKKTQRIFYKAQQREKKLFKKILKVNPSFTADWLNISGKQYEQMTNKLNHAGSAMKIPYLGYLDTIKTSFAFLLQQNLNHTGGNQLKSLENIEQQFGKAEMLRKYLNERRKFFQENLSERSMLKEIKKFNKDVYYYTEQLKEYKSILNNSKRFEQKAINALKRIPSFNRFFQENSQVNALFNPVQKDDRADVVYTSGELQTRAAVIQYIQQQLGNTVDPENMLQQQVTQAETILSVFKNKIDHLSKDDSEMELPDFNRSQQKTKSFLNRLEYGVNFQSEKGTNRLPARSEAGFTAGYQLNGKSIIGIGGSYALSWGEPFRNIKIEHESVGVRSFIDWKLKGSFYISGGYEKFYNIGFNRFSELRSTDKWEERGLLGVSKKYSLGKKKGSLQLLWNFLHDQQTVQRQPLIFRMGYTL